MLEGDSKAPVERVFSLEHEIDQLEHDIETRCMRMLLQQQPVATDLRKISSALKMITDMERIGDQVRTAAYEIIKAKKATYYGIGMAIVRICKAILNNEKSILTISCEMKGEYDLNGVYLGMPCIVDSTGARNIIRLSLTRSESAQLHASADFLSQTYRDMHL